MVIQEAAEMYLETILRLKKKTGGHCQRDGLL